MNEREREREGEREDGDEDDVFAERVETSLSPIRSEKAKRKKSF